MFGSRTRIALEFAMPRTPTSTAIALASLPAPRGFKEACQALRARLGRSLTEAELRRVDHNLRLVRMWRMNPAGDVRKTHVPAPHLARNAPGYGTTQSHTSFYPYPLIKVFH